MNHVIAEFHQHFHRLVSVPLGHSSNCLNYSHWDRGRPLLERNVASETNMSATLQQISRQYNMPNRLLWPTDCRVVPPMLSCRQILRTDAWNWKYSSIVMMSLVSQKRCASFSTLFFERMQADRLILLRWSFNVFSYIPLWVIVISKDVPHHFDV